MDVRANEREGKRADRIVNSSARGRKGKQTGRAAHWKGFREKGVSLLPLYPLSLARSVCVCVHLRIRGRCQECLLFRARSRKTLHRPRHTMWHCGLRGESARTVRIMCKKEDEIYTQAGDAREREREWMIKTEMHVSIVRLRHITRAAAAVSFYTGSINVPSNANCQGSTARWKDNSHVRSKVFVQTVFFNSIFGILYSRAGIRSSCGIFTI